MYLRADILDDLLKEAFELVISKGKPTEASRGRTLEVTGVLLELENPRARLSRSETKGRPFSCLGELLWYLSGSDKLEFIERYIPAYACDAEDDGTLHGAYGPRLYDMDGQNQITNVTDLLREKPGSRRAVIQLYSAQDIAKRYKEISVHHHDPIPPQRGSVGLLRDHALERCVQGASARRILFHHDLRDHCARARLRCWHLQALCWELSPIRGQHQRRAAVSYGGIPFIPAYAINAVGIAVALCSAPAGSGRRNQKGRGRSGDGPCPSTLLARSVQVAFSVRALRTFRCD